MYKNYKSLLSDSQNIPVDLLTFKIGYLFELQEIVLFEIQLKNYEKVQEPWEMSDEEKINQANICKDIHKPVDLRFHKEVV